MITQRRLEPREIPQRNKAQAALDLCTATHLARVSSSPHFTQPLGGRAIRGGISLGTGRRLD
jgi:hypothetical protein